MPPLLVVKLVVITAVCEATDDKVQQKVTMRMMLMALQMVLGITIKTGQLRGALMRKSVKLVNGECSASSSKQHSTRTAPEGSPLQMTY